MSNQALVYNFSLRESAVWTAPCAEKCHFEMSCLRCSGLRLPRRPHLNAENIASDCDCPIWPDDRGTLRAQRLKKCNLDWNFQSRLKISISIEIFNPDLQNSPQIIGVCWGSRLKFSISIENFNPGGRSWIFSIFGPLGYWTMEMNGGSSAPYLARTPCVPLFCTLFNIRKEQGT